MSVRIDLDTSDYDSYIPRFIRGLGRLGERFVDEGTKILYDKMFAIINVKTGRLQRSIVREISGHIGVVKTTAGYGGLVSAGFGPHEIAARIARVLRFEISGQVLFRRRVMHPGYAGSHFAERTVAESQSDIREMLIRVYREETAK